MKFKYIILFIAVCLFVVQPANVMKADLASDILKKTQELAAKQKIKRKKLNEFILNNVITVDYDGKKQSYKFNKNITYEVYEGKKVVGEGTWAIKGLTKSSIKLSGYRDLYFQIYKAKDRINTVTNLTKKNDQQTNRKILKIVSTNDFKEQLAQVEPKKEKALEKKKKVEEKKKQVAIETKKEEETIEVAEDIQEEEVQESEVKTEEKTEENEVVTEEIEEPKEIAQEEKSKDVAESKSSTNQKNEFQYTLNFIPANTSNISETIENSGALSLFLGLNRNKAYGLYQGESINGVPSGKGKWSNCYSKRYQIISKDRKFIDTISKKYQEGIISLDEYISEISNKVKLALPLSYISGGLTFDSSMNEKRVNYHFGDLGCEVIVGNWKHGSLNGYVKIFPLSIPKFIYPEGLIKEKLNRQSMGRIIISDYDTWSIRSDEIHNLEEFWKNDKNINISTSSLEHPYYREGISKFYPYGVLKSKDKFVNIMIRKYVNDVATEDLKAKITVNKGHGILSSLNEKGNAEGPGLTLFADGSIILSNYKNGKMDFDQNIIAYINSKKNSPKYNSKKIGQLLEKNVDTYKDLIPNFSLALKNIEIISENRRKKEFLIKSSFLKKRPSINQTIYDWGKYSPYRNLGEWVKEHKAHQYQFSIDRFDEEIHPFTYYYGKITEFNDKGQLVYNGIGKKVNYTEKKITLEEGEFKNGTFVKGFQLYDQGSQPRTNIKINYSYKRQKKQNHTSELYYGTLNKNGPHGKGTMIMPNGTVYIGEWKNNNFHGKGELRRYRGKKEPFKTSSGSKTKFIPSLKYSLKGEFKNGIPDGKMEGYIYEAKRDAAGIIFDIIKQDISGDYIEGKLLAKAPKKKLKRPEIKGDSVMEFPKDLKKVKNMGFEIGCIDHEMKGNATIDYILMPCENYEEYEKAMAKAISQGQNISFYDESGRKIEKKTIGDKKTFKSGKSLFLNISKETEDSFFVKNVEVKKFKNPSKIQKVDFNVSKCEILESKGTNEGDLNYENTKYIIDIENLLVKRTRKDKESGSIEGKIFSINRIYIPDIDQNPLDVSYYDDEKNNFVPQISPNEIKAFIDKYHFARSIRISTHSPKVRIAFDYKKDMKQYTLALADESLTIDIPLNKDKIKDNKYLKSGYVVVTRVFGMFLYDFGHGNDDRTAVFDPMELSTGGKRIKEVCSSLKKEDDSGVEIAESEVEGEDKVGSLKYYHKKIKDSGIVGLINYGVGGEGEPFFDGYAQEDVPFNGRQSLEKIITRELEEGGKVLEPHELKFQFALQCESGDYYFIGIDTEVKRFKSNRPDLNKQIFKSDVPVYHLIQFGRFERQRNDAFTDTEGNILDVISKHHYRYNNLYSWKRVPKGIVSEKISEDLIEVTIDKTKINDWQRKYRGSFQDGKLIGEWVKQYLKIDLRNNKVYHKHFEFFDDDPSSSTYKPPKEVAYESNCKKIAL